MMAIGVLAFAVGLMICVMLHEAGHFVAAKFFGMKATQFFVGFGPTLWSRQRGDTEYGIKAIPAGGFVKIVGMTPLEDLAPEDQAGAFINKPGWDRFVVLVAGSTMHFILAFIFFFAFAVGWPTHDTGGVKVAAVSSCLSHDASDTSSACTAGTVTAPAAGVLRAGDVILAVDGKTLKDAVVLDTDPGAKPGATVKGGPAALPSLIKSSTGPLKITLVRAGATQTVEITPVVIGGVRKIGVSDEPEYTRLGPVAAVGSAFGDFGTVISGSAGAVGKIPSAIGNIFSAHPPKRTASGQGASVSSVVGIARIAGQGFASGGFYGGTAELLTLLGSVNLFVGIFNLLPFLPLDGGHVAILGYEKLRNAWRRRRHLIPAGPVDLNKLMPLTYGFLAIIVAVSALILFSDIVNPVANPFTQ
ncbi:MAG TPA: site-2 protease family protein [Acidothermaceae bacterium]|jgi:membrane-associated protease RseP (regulator of RpoE activity)